MNAERLHAIALILNKEMDDGKIINKMQEIIESLDSVIHQQDAAQSQQDLVDNLKNIHTALENTPSDNFSPAWRQILEEIGGKDLFGGQLKAMIEGIFQRNAITPAVALHELDKIQSDLQLFKTSLEQMITAFRLFNIGDEILDPGQCEIGMLIPRTAVDNRLSEFAEELKELAFIFNTISEVATGKKDDLSIKTISSTDLMVYLDALPNFAACVAVAIERTVALYKQLLEIKKLRGELLKQNVPQEQTKGIEDHANRLMETGIEKLSKEIVKEYYKGNDGGRKHELINAMRIALNRIANRIDRGFNIEVRVAPLEKKEEEGEASAQTIKHIETIQSAEINMQFLKLEGGPILRLPESTEKPKAKK